MKELILKALKENMGQYVSGEMLSSLLGVSRTTVWKNISTLRKEGYHIESSTRNGYKLVSMPDIISALEISKNLSTKIIGKNIIYVDKVASTNTLAKEAAAEVCQEGTLVIADHQTSGRGRLGRAWLSPPQVGICMSIVLRPNITPDEAPFITILSALAVADAIEQVTNIRPAIKWPNDIIINNAKVCGILTEISAEIDKIHYLVVGIGINVNHEQHDFSPDIREIATSLKIAKGEEFERTPIIRTVLENFEQNYLNAWCSHSRKQFLDRYRKYSCMLGKQVKVTWHDRIMEGCAVDITERGELLVQTIAGDIVKVFSGEVSVRGL